MRDYSFGNFLHELRVRRGLSQYQLGMLVGVSNKAVSKWENGSAKPQSRILYKLSEALGITVDELLACKYRSAENKKRKGVFAMKNALWKKAGEALAGRYGNVPPMEVSNRYYSEYAELKNTDQIIYFEFLSRLAKQGKRSGGHIGIEGGIGASFVAFVMGATEINPLRPHYYCPDCHKIRFAENVLCGWDLPAKKCSCGRELVRDGHNIPFETLRPIIRRAVHYDIAISQNLYQAAEKMISSCFPGNKAAQCPAITLMRNKELDVFVQLEEETGIAVGRVPFTDKQVIEAFLEGSTEGIPEFNTDFAGNIMAESGPQSIHDLIQIFGLCHGTGVWERNERALVMAGRPMGSLIAYRDDVFCYIQEKMKPEYGSGTGYAYRVMEDVRRGMYARNGIPAEVRQHLLELGGEEWMIESLGKIQYLFPKAHAILHVKRAMLLMWYKIHYPAAFDKIVLKKKG